MNEPAAEQPAGREVVNYDDIWDFEPRQTSIGTTELWGRGIPRAPLVYAIVLTIVLLAVTRLPFLPLGFLTGLQRVVVCAVIAGGLSAWAWMLPPGGVKPHRAALPMLRGLLAPVHLHGWRALRGEVEDVRPAPLPIEPDFTGVWPRSRYHGPGLLIRTGGAAQTVPPMPRFGRRRGPALVLEQGTGSRPTPHQLQVKAGASVELQPAAGPEEKEIS